MRGAFNVCGLILSTLLITAAVSLKPKPGQWYNIISVHNKLAVSLKDDRTYKGSIVQLELYNGANQHFIFEEVQPNTFKMIAQNSGLVVEVHQDEQGIVRTNDFQFEENQLWILDMNSDNVTQIQSKHSSFCLDVPYGSYEEGVELGTYTCEKSNHQLWKIQVW